MRWDAEGLVLIIASRHCYSRLCIDQRLLRATRETAKDGFVELVFVRAVAQSGRRLCARGLIGISGKTPASRLAPRRLAPRGTLIKARPSALKTPPMTHWNAEPCLIRCYAP